MSILEYNEEKHLKDERDEWRKIGRKEGEAVGEERLSRLMKALFHAGRSEDVQRVLSDIEYRKQLYREYNIS